jgi:hypothetical protein
MPIILYGLALQLAVSAVKQRRDVSGGFEPLKPLRHVAVPPTVAEESFSIRRNIMEEAEKSASVSLLPIYVQSAE